MVPSLQFMGRDPWSAHIPYFYLLSSMFLLSALIIIDSTYYYHYCQNVKYFGSLYAAFKYLLYNSSSLFVSSYIFKTRFEQLVIPNICVYSTRLNITIEVHIRNLCCYPSHHRNYWYHLQTNTMVSPLHHPL